MSKLDNILGKIVTLDEAKKIVADWKKQGEKIVFTNGCFDIIHKGHVFYLAQARELGSKLILGLNTDESIAKLKGPDRPVKELESRALTIASFEYIDLVIPFSEDTPLNLISTLLPDVLVKGSDYSIENIVGAKEVLANGGEVKTIDFVEGFSSTNYFKKIKTATNS
ncbi:MAG: D-glycero-beta-D-manno-heptose 1-phosphate adenylyltransferase [Bacteroidales bacterium]|nr:D-glycero-beta-D-manno-heptose 1-phosphate adenylyltransferase [Bacteroidales bacterium]